MKNTRVGHRNAIPMATDPNWAEIPLTPAVSSLVDLLVEMACQRFKAVVELPLTSVETNNQ